MNDFWSVSGTFINRHHVEPRVKLYSPREESFPIPLKYIDVSRTTHTNLDVKQERPIDDYWNVDVEICLINGQVSLNLHCEKKKPPTGYLWGETDKTAGNIQTRLFMARTLHEIRKRCPGEGEARMVT